MLVAQVMAVVIFIAMFVLIVMDKIERQYVTLGCGLMTLVIVFGVCMHSWESIWRTLSLRSIFKIDFWYRAGEAAESSAGINWATIIFIAGMMVMVEGMARVGFFRWLCMEIAKLVHYKTIPIFITFMIISSVLAMFIDSITVILFLAAVTIELAKLLKFNPVPMVVAEIFCANLGGSATMCGDPPNIIIGTAMNYSFGDFVTNTGLMAAVSLIAVVIYFYLVFRKELKNTGGAADSVKNQPDPRDAIKDKQGFVISTVIFLCAVLLLVTHAITGLTVAFIGVFISILTLATAGKEAVGLLKKLDYKTLLFFVGLFIVVGGLEETGILNVISNFIENISGGNLYAMVAIILWVSAFASAVVDNIPFAATMVPVVTRLAALSGGSTALQAVLAWSLSMGTDIGGSATPIGASANVVGIAEAEKEGHHIGWKKYCLAAIPATILVLLISMAIIFLRYGAELA